MPKYNLDDYETVKQRKHRFRADYSDGRIEVSNISENPTDYAFMFAQVFRDREDQKEELPLGEGYALEIRDKELSTSKKGYDYESVNYTSWTENCEESAIGRALDNAGYASNGKCSREEMEKAERMKEVKTDTSELIKQINEKLDEKQFSDEERKAGSDFIVKWKNNPEALKTFLQRLKDKDLDEAADKAFPKEEQPKNAGESQTQIGVKEQDMF
ncbi:hypothetical protein GF348_09300 [candidate division KSB3 bacterium]|nr:hypothetical protein [candidate division KSB3 bacterium]